MKQTRLTQYTSVEEEEKPKVPKLFIGDHGLTGCTAEPSVAPCPLATIHPNCIRLTG